MKFNPIHSYMCTFFAYTIYNLIIGFKKQNINELIIDIIMVFSCMIYLEIIELNFCCLNYNLKKKIKDRSEKEIEKILETSSSYTSH
jgi:hypothetical protein